MKNKNKILLIIALILTFMNVSAAVLFFILKWLKFIPIAFFGVVASIFLIVNYHNKAFNQK